MLLRARSVRRLGSDIRLWSASYLLYLLAVFFPQSSTFRLLMPLTPLVGALAVPRSRAYRWGMLLLCLLLQWFWILAMYGSAQTYWQVPSASRRASGPICVAAGDACQRQPINWSHTTEEREPRWQR